MDRLWDWKISVPAVNFGGSLKNHSSETNFFIIVFHPMKMTFRSIIASSTLPREIFFQTVGFEDLLAPSHCAGSD